MTDAPRSSPAGAAAVSPWMADPVALAPPLAGDLEVDVAIVGAGYTGLSTALALRAEGMRVAVLEAEHAGFGASGRNAGHLTPTIGKDPPTLLRLFGRERCRALIALVETAIAHVERTIATHAIDCAYEPVGNVLAAVHPMQYAMIDRAARVGAEIGADGELLEPAEMRRRGLPPRFLRGYFERRGGILHPGRYVRGLRAAALAAGALLFERTPIGTIEEGPVVTLVTPGGRVRARHVVLATNAFTPALGRLRGTIVPVTVYLFRTAPLTAAARAALDWRGREGIYTAHEMLESYRLTDDQRIVGGAKTVRYRFGSRIDTRPDPAVFTALEEAFHDRFPELGDVEITDRWGGPIAIGLDFLPHLGRTGRYRNLLYSVGYAGHGVALASYAGVLVADLLLEREGAGTVLTARRFLPLPPEPFRWLTVRALTAFFAAVDRRRDRAVRAAAG